MKVNILQRTDGYRVIVRDGMVADVAGIDFATKSEAKKYAAIRGWQVVPQHRKRTNKKLRAAARIAKVMTGIFGGEEVKREARIVDILIVHEKESGSNIREFYSLAGKIMTEIGTWKEERPK